MELFLTSVLCPFCETRSKGWHRCHPSGWLRGGSQGLHRHKLLPGLSGGVPAVRWARRTERGQGLSQVRGLCFGGCLTLYPALCV